MSSTQAASWEKNPIPVGVLEVAFAEARGRAFRVAVEPDADTPGHFYVVLSLRRTAIRTPGLRKWRVYDEGVSFFVAPNLQILDRNDEHREYVGEVTDLPERARVV